MIFNINRNNSTLINLGFRGEILCALQTCNNLIVPLRPPHFTCYHYKVRKNIEMKVMTHSLKRKMDYFCFVVSSNG